MPEISNIKPTDVRKPRGRPRFTYDDSAYRSYIQEGFELPIRAPNRKEENFLSKVDLKHGKIKVRISRIIRQRAIDYSTEKEEEKEYLTYVSDWSAKNYQEIPLFVRSHVEGVHQEQTKQLAMKWDGETGESEPYYQKGAPRNKFTIPFTPKKVDEILYHEHPFGEDAENITNPDRVIYYGKFDNILGITAFRCADYTHDQFVTPKWSEFMGLAIRTGGPALRVEVKQKPSFIS